MSDYLGRWADLNCDGEVDDFEEFVALENLDSDEEEFDDEEERRKALEDAGLDPDDFDFY